MMCCIGHDDIPTHDLPVLPPLLRFLNCSSESETKAANRMDLRRRSSSPSR
jgi:hypothetical protein